MFIKRSRTRGYLLIAAFLLIILLPTADNIFHFSPVKELFEKRLPISRPQFSYQTKRLITYPQEFEAFYDDHFGWRKTLISWHSKIIDKIFNESPSERAVIGKEGWLFFNNKGSLLDTEGRLSYNPQTLDKGIKALVNNWQKLRAQNIAYVLVIAPDKSSVYPEYLPNLIHPTSPSRLDQFLTRLKASHPDFPVINLKETLIKAKAKEKVYYQTDTHWNKRGTFIGYQEIIHFLNQKYPTLKIKPLKKQDFITPSEQKRGDIADIMNLDIAEEDINMLPKLPYRYKPAHISDEEQHFFHKPQFFTNSNPNLPILFSYKDSFMDSLLEFLSGHFAKSYYINEFPCDLSLTIIKRYKPNLVIQEMWEGRMEEVLNSCP